MADPIECAGRVFYALRKAGRRTAPARSYTFHAVTSYCRMALCSAEPGTSSGWAEPPAEEVTCPQCLRRLDRLRGNKPQPVWPRSLRAQLSGGSAERL